MNEDVAAIVELSQKLQGELSDEDVQSCLRQLEVHVARFKQMVSKCDICGKDAVAQ